MTDLLLHAPVQGATDAFWETARALGAAGYVWLAADTNGPHRPQDAQRDPGKVHLVRVPTIVVNEPIARYVDRVAPIIAAWVAAVPTAIVIPGNEPDIQAGNDVPAAWDGTDWTWQAIRVATALRRAFPGIILGCPAFSVERTGLLSPSLAAAFDVVTAHCYWEGTSRTWQDDCINNHGLGQAWRLAANIAAGKPLYVTEVNCVHTDEAIVAAGNWSRVDQLLEWLRYTGGSGGGPDPIAGAAFFIADPANYWPDHPFTVQHAQALRQVVNNWPDPWPVVDNPPVPVDNGGNAVDERALIAAVDAKTADLILRAALLMGPALETGRILAPFPDQYGGGPGRGPYQIEAGPGGWHYGRISEADARDPAKALDYMFGSYQGSYAAADRGADDMPHYLAKIVAGAERPAAYGAGNVYGYPEDRIVAAYSLIFPETGFGAPVQPPPPHTDDPVQDTTPPRFTGRDVVAEALRWLGCTDRGLYDPNNGHGTPYLWCEAFAEAIPWRVTGVRLSIGTALAHGIALDAAGRLHHDTDAPAGSWVIWGEAFWPDGHIAISLGDGRYIGTTVDGIQIGTGWQFLPGYLGWAMPDGIGADTEDADMRHDGKLDAGLAEYLWRVGRDSEGQPIALNPDSGLYTAWRADLLAGRPWGEPRSQEMKIEDGSQRVIQVFALGIGQAYPDGTVAFN